MSDALFEQFALHGLPLSTSANEPLPLIDPDAVWLVTNGHVDVVAMTIMREAESSELQRTHLLRIGKGQLIFGLHPPSAGQNVLLLGFGSADGQVSRLSVSKLAELTDDPERRVEVLALVERWVAAVCALGAQDLPPAGAQNLRPGTRLDLGPGQCAQPQSGVLWVRFAEGSARFMGHRGRCEVGNCRGDMVLPLSKDVWIQAMDEGACRVEASAAGAVALDEAFWCGLDCFNTAIETLIDAQRMRDLETDRQRLRRKGEQSRATVAGAVSELGAVLSGRGGGRGALSPDNALLAACQLIGERIGVEFINPGARRTRGDANPLERIARASRVMLREVRLQGGWWKGDNGPILGFIGQGESPVALLPDSPTSYSVHNPADGTVRRVNAKVAAELDPSGFVFVRSLPDRALGGMDLVRFGLRSIGRDLFTVMAMGSVGGVLVLVLPMAMGLLIDRVIPSADRGQLFQLTIGLIVAALAGAAFQITRNVALTRVQHRAGAAIQAALWNRLINLPTKFFGKYSSGDLATRAMGIDTIMAEMSTSVITTIVSSMFSVFALALLFYYSPAAAVVAMLLILLFVGAIVACGAIQFRYQKQLEEGHGKMASLLFQLMNGIGKIRVAAAEDRAFARWASGFSKLTRLRLRSRIVSNNLSVFAAAFPVMTYMVIFYLISSRSTQQGFSTGSFLAFLSAYTTLLRAMIELGTTAVGVLNVVPIYQRLVPILKAEPEVSAGKTPVGRLRGAIEVTNVSFRYAPDGPLILDRVSVSAEPGEFVAIVGSSGSGKSTLLRLLLGFEEPESGTIAFDGADASGLDPQGLRRQIGVVLQSGDVFPGDLFTNIVGSAVDLSHTDAWEAARQAGLDRDIEQMPMGMHTQISEGTGGISGGQKQRLMIARALVTKPRIVFFDEATSALDNPTQAVVTASLDRLRATRVVIAHRLSTVVGADKIYVMEKGRVVQAGSYDQLINVPGPFFELVKRQIA